MPDHLSVTLAALADPTRRAILSQLSQGDASVSELAQPFDMSTQAISKHVAVLERAGLVTRRRDAQRNLSRLQLKRLQEVDEWLADYRQFWERRLDNVAHVLSRIKKGDLHDPRRKRG